MPDNLDLVLEALRRSNRELYSAIIDESTLENVSIEEACEALRAQTKPVDVEVRESKRSPWLDLAEEICVKPFRIKQ